MPILSTHVRFPYNPWVKCVLLAVYCLVTVLSIGLIAQPDSFGQSSRQKIPRYIGGSNCIACHDQQYKLWQKSHHAWSLLEPDTTTVLGDFSNRTVTHQDINWNFYRHGNKFLVKTIGPENKPAEFEIKYAVGKEPLQQYLVELPGGRLQSLDMAWDTENRRWFHLYPEQKFTPADGLHWTGPYKNWNGRCAVCHSTNYRKNYDSVQKVFRSEWSDINVSCEACHGPGEAHVVWARSSNSDGIETFSNVNALGLVGKQDKSQTMELIRCAGCHSRRSALDADSPLPGSKFSDHYRLALLSPELYFPDGQIKDEVYVYGSFLQSKMHSKGVRCSNCHDPHSGSLVAEGNLVCAQCHNSEGNPDFPTLKKKTYDDVSHHHHKPASEGARCVNCHMPARTYMQVDPRRDHSFKIPWPELSLKIGTPNACTGCHQDQKPEWAVLTLQKWFPERRMNVSDPAEIFHLARQQNSPGIGERLLKLAFDKQYPAITRATALQLLRPMLTTALADKAIPLITDSSELVRREALSLFSQFPRNIRAERSARSLLDPSRTVRFEAARLVFDVPPNQLPANSREAVKNVMKDYQTSLKAMADFPAIQLNLSGLALGLGNLPAAEKALKTAVAMDPQLDRAWSLLARIQIQTRQLDAASKTLEQALKRAGPSAEIYQILARVRTFKQNQSGAVEAYREALKLAPENADLYLELAAFYYRHRRYNESMTVSRDLLKIRPDNLLGLELLALNFVGTNQLLKARDTVKKIRRLDPTYRLNRQLAPLAGLP